jgi:hypothetical protein
MRLGMSLVHTMSHSNQHLSSFTSMHRVRKLPKNLWLSDIHFLGPDIVGLHNPGARGDTLQTVSDSIIGYTTNKLLDSNQGTGFPVLPRKGDNSTVYNFQLFRCSRVLVQQYATLDTETGKIIPSSLHPNLQKNHSSWHLYNSSSDNDNSGTLIGGDSVGCITSTRDNVWIIKSGQPFLGAFHQLGCCRENSLLGPGICK